mmetsp:Transcript_4128/g.8938  ORF Transcript_4128/g.8938 Transcript_4128/m.8938 type:complete len:256 (-) Transcript_4128:408-1175(-)
MRVGHVLSLLAELVPKCWRRNYACIGCTEAQTLYTWLLRLRVNLPAPEAVERHQIPHVMRGIRRHFSSFDITASFKSQRRTKDEAKLQCIAAEESAHAERLMRLSAATFVNAAVPACMHTADVAPSPVRSRVLQTSPSTANLASQTPKTLCLPSAANLAGELRRTKSELACAEQTISKTHQCSIKLAAELKTSELVRCGINDELRQQRNLVASKELQLEGGQPKTSHVDAGKTFLQGVGVAGCRRGVGERSAGVA